MQSITDHIAFITQNNLISVRGARFVSRLAWLVGICLIQCMAMAQPQPGDLFREYIWIPEMVKSENGRFLRVGGKLDYQINQDHFPIDRHQDGYILIERFVELQGAVKAEVVLEKIGSHEDTKNLRISINRNPFMVVPEAQGIPEPQSDYMYHFYPVVDIPLDQLNLGIDNAFKLEVDTAQRWNWPQHLIYGVILRIYYDQEALPEAVRLSGVEPQQALGETVKLSIGNPSKHIRNVDYVGFYEGINYEGDGVYQQWHYHYYRGRLTHHIGSSNMYPFESDWNTSWIPDQTEPMQLAARVTFNSGLIYFTQAVTNLTLQRNHAVELVKPYEQPKNWVTRSDEFESKIDIKGDPKQIEEVKLYWTSWSPCYSNGIYINDVKVFDKEGPCYDYMAHEVLLNDASILQTGTNIIKTGKEPLHDGKMVHGMEVQWPGIMMLIKYSTDN